MMNQSASDAMQMELVKKYAKADEFYMSASNLERLRSIAYTTVRFIAI
jgi:hypothetical protein